MYIEFRSGPLDGKRVFLPVPAESIVGISDSDLMYHYRRTPRRLGDIIIYQYLGLVSNERESIDNSGVC